MRKPCDGLRVESEMALHTTKVLSLCSGIGGLDLAVQTATRSRTICYVERESFAASLLVERMEKKELDHAPMWDDLTTFEGQPWRGIVDLIVAGFPCQPVSQAGKRKGQEDERWIWDDIVRIIREVRPGFVFLENVTGILSMGLGGVLGDLAQLGFDAEWIVLRASDVGAPHQRKRWFCLGYTNNDRREGSGVHLQRRGQEQAVSCFGGTGAGVAHSNRVGDERRRTPGQLFCKKGKERPKKREPDFCGDSFDDSGEILSHKGVALGDPNLERSQRWSVRERGRANQWSSREAGGQGLFPPAPEDESGWREFIKQYPKAEPAVCRDADGVSDRVDRLRGLGNAVVPLQAAVALRVLADRAEVSL